MPFASGASHSHARAVTTQGRNAKDARKATHTRQKLGQLLAKEFRQRSELQPQKPVLYQMQASIVDVFAVQKLNDAVHSFF